jgi:hypothetical protein
MKDKFIANVWHWQVGMLRRPEMDDDNGFCYEEADGDLVFSADPRHETHLRLSIWETPDGTRYTALAKNSTLACRFLR